MQNTKAEYSIVKGIADDRELEKYRLCFLKDGVDRSRENLNWLHHENLLHTNTIYYAMRDTEMAAIYTALPVIFKINGKLVPALQSIDTLTDIDHRGKGLFIKLANSLYKDASASNTKLIYGFPNPNSAPGFYQKLQWHSFGEVPFLIKPLNTFYLLKKVINRTKHTDFSSSNYIFDAPFTVPLNGNTIFRRLSSFDESYELLWRLASEKIQVCVDRSAAYMNWRYMNKPGEHYYSYGIFDNEKLCGAIVFSLKYKHGGLVGTVMELVFDPAKTSLGKNLLNFAAQLCKKQKADVMLSWCLPGSFNYVAYKKSGFYALPEKIRPQKLYMGVRVFDQSLASVVYNVKNWYISYSDSDTA